ncbi:hypothetical protein JAAARDRAFT_418466 [Jaapia argillacea MUCL 33604]|uniref:Uncharacterized protein n=1 Tax=Jaapia argillacea MUCL 33604 TaxID=933084 RepID=A0A067PRM4_9AGAM|nr:hypothetical protein JAAARDRAFT_418466 [Jaapia argillacea MUCL 33604]
MVLQQQMLMIAGSDNRLLRPPHGLAFLSDASRVDEPSRVECDAPRRSNQSISISISIPSHSSLSFPLSRASSSSSSSLTAPPNILPRLRELNPPPNPTSSISINSLPSSSSSLRLPECERSEELGSDHPPVPSDVVDNTP